MRNLLRKCTRYARNEAGLTLIELLASMTIFIVILLPLSSVYISGITTYSKTQVQTSLRNEADFVIGDIMNKLQNASYFDLDTGKGITDEKEEVLELFGSVGMIPDGEDNDFDQGITTYKRKVKYEALDSSAEKSPVSTLEKKVYQLVPPSQPEEISNQELYNLFSYDSAYLVYGLFRIRDDETTNNKRVSIYLIIAPKAQGDAVEHNGQKTAFKDLAEIKEEVKHLQLNQSAETAPDENTILFNYIYMVKTEVSVNSLSQE